jgi:hypothetical protein
MNMTHEALPMFTPPSEMRRICALGLASLARIEDVVVSNDVLEWARKIADGDNITTERLRAVRAWMRRNASKAIRASQDSPDWVVFALWGGEPAQRWADKVLRGLSTHEGTSTMNQKYGPGSRPIAPKTLGDLLAGIQLTSIGGVDSFELAPAAVTMRTVHPTIALDASLVPEPSSAGDAKPVSTSVIQLAKCGEFKGHSAGPFELTPEVFAEIVTNFEATANRHVPVDFEHGTERVEPESSVFQRGAPAVGWVVALDNRGEAGLYGTVEWCDTEAVSWIRAGKYRYFSPAIVFGGVDRVSGKAIGAQLVSGGLTNRPFLDGMEPIAARTPATAPAATPAAAAVPGGASGVLTLAAPQATGGRQFNLSLQDTVRSDVVETLKFVFELDELATETDVVASLELLAEYVSNPALAGGVAVASIIDSLRYAFRIPRLTKSSAVIEKVLAYLKTTATAPAVATDTAPTPEETTMTTKNMSDVAPAAPAPVAPAAPSEDELKAKATTDALAAAKAFKDACMAALGMDAEHEVAEDEIITSIKAKLGELETLQKDVEAKAKADADAEVEAVAARANVTDPKRLAAMRKLRSNDVDTFRELYAEHITAKPAAPPAAAPSTALRAGDVEARDAATQALTTTIAASSAASRGPEAIALANRTEHERAGEANGKAHLGALALMRAPDSKFPTYGAALKEAARLVAAGESV